MQYAMACKIYYFVLHTNSIPFTLKLMLSTRLNNLKQT